MNNYEKKMVEALKLENYESNEVNKSALVEVSSELFLASDYSFESGGKDREIFNKVFSELIINEGEEKVPMNLQRASKMFGLSLDAIMDFGKARVWYEANKTKFDLAYLPVYQQAILKYPELINKEEGKNR